MKVREIMSRDVEWCAPETNLAAAGERMWNRDCGALPVLSDGKLAGIITDRDICIALATRNLRANEVAVQDVVTKAAQACYAEDDVAKALEIMRTAKVRRLPVLNLAGKLEGMLSLNDIALHAVPKHRSVGYEHLVSTEKAIGEHVARKMPSAEAAIGVATATA